MADTGERGTGCPACGNKGGKTKQQSASSRLASGFLSGKQKESSTKEQSSQKSGASNYSGLKTGFLSSSQGEQSSSSATHKKEENKSVPKSDWLNDNSGSISAL